MTPTAPADPVDSVYRIARSCLIAGFAATVALVAVALVLVGLTGDPIETATMALGDLPGALRAGEPGAFAEVAMFAIVLTPVVTTVGLIVGFARIGDRTYAGVSALVLLVLSVSITIALVR